MHKDTFQHLFQEKTNGNNLNVWVVKWLTQIYKTSIVKDSLNSQYVDLERCPNTLSSKTSNVAAN